MQMQSNIYLVGFMGTGKTTVAANLMNFMEYQMVDLDQAIEAQQGKTINEIFANDGEDAFRNMETEIIKDYSCQSGFVISCGGGAVLRQENVETMKRSGLVVWLTATPKTIYQRIKTANNRPLLQGHMEISEIAKRMEKRHAAYAEAANLIVATDDKTAVIIAQEIKQTLKKLK
jgi:shikimate kinase